jgi:signal transduction histidine kinase
LFRRDHPTVSATAARPAEERTEDPNREPQRARGPRGLSGFIFASEYLVLAFTAFLVALIWGAVGYQIDHDRMAILDTAQVNTSNLARAYAEHVQGTLQLLDQALLRVKKEYESKSRNPDFLRRVMSDEQLDAQFVPMGVTDQDGYVIASNLRTVSDARLPPQASPAAIYAGDRDYFRAQKDDQSGRVYVGTPIVSRINEKTAITLSRRLNAADGRFAGVVFASFDLDYLSGFFSDLAIGKNSSFSIVSRDMVILDMIRGTGRATELVGKSVPKPRLVPALAEAPNGDYEAESPVDGVDRLYSYRSLPKYQLVVLASAARPDILANFSERKHAMLWTAALLSLIFVAVAAFQLRRIAKTRRYEIALHRSNEKLARAQRLATIGCFDHDVGTDVAECSDELYHILGLEPSDAVPGRDTLIALIHPEDRERFERHRAAELAGKVMGPLEYRIVRADGTERIVRRETAIVFDNDTRCLRRYGTLQDVTTLRLGEQRERDLERKLLHSQKLEALGTLAGGIAHDLNNTLTPIMALSKVTARRLAHDEELRSNLEMIFAASEQARDLVRRVLSFSRRDKVEKLLVGPSAIVNDSLLLMRATIPSSIHLVSRVEAVPEILADPSQIHQVVTNLVTNAAQAIDVQSGTITVLLERTGNGKRGDEIHLSVIDTGQGMDEGTRRRIFEPFFTTKEVGQGTGLGLSIIDGIVSGHGGCIEVASEPGKGTRFDVYFPIPAATATSAAA